MREQISVIRGIKNDNYIKYFDKLVKMFNDTFDLNISIEVKTDAENRESDNSDT